MHKNTKYFTVVGVKPVYVQLVVRSDIKQVTHWFKADNKQSVVRSGNRRLIDWQDTRNKLATQ